MALLTELVLKSSTNPSAQKVRWVPRQEEPNRRFALPAHYHGDSDKIPPLPQPKGGQKLQRASPIHCGFEIWSFTEVWSLKFDVFPLEPPCSFLQVGEGAIGGVQVGAIRE